MKKADCRFCGFPIAQMYGDWWHYSTDYQTDRGCRAAIWSRGDIDAWLAEGHRLAAAGKRTTYAAPLKGTVSGEEG